MENTLQTDIGHYLAKSKNQRKKLADIAKKYIQGNPKDSKRTPKYFSERCKMIVLPRSPQKSDKELRIDKSNFSLDHSKFELLIDEAAENLTSKNKRPKAKYSKKYNSVQRIMRLTYLNAFPKSPKNQLEISPISREYKIKIPNPILSSRRLSLNGSFDSNLSKSFSTTQKSARFSLRISM
ncbi:unnamed protein product [Blepharisma stoltei]|uniref:Uncharacterized protein n=1 Tax=Blepharisma stoltei TaxID=1481888 RepID=A0AAU9JMF2_9CILI|nr:unnamed protein product [Blepharisma stoltei]